MNREEMLKLAAQLFVTYMNDDELIEKAMQQAGPEGATEYLAQAALDDARTFFKVATERKETP